MTAEAIYLKDSDVVTFVAGAALASGEVFQLPDGRAGVIQGLNARASGDQAGLRVRGIVTVLKTADINILQGGRVFWDRSASTATYKAASGDFYMGVAAADSLAAATTVQVDLNVKQANQIEFDGNANGECLWAQEATDGLGVVEPTLAVPTTLAFDAVAEVGQAALYPADAVNHMPVADGIMCEMILAVYDIGDNGALDITFGIANGTHATDFDSVTEACVFHLDGTALSILAESDDGTTEVAATDTTVDAVDDTFLEVWIDARDTADIQLYIDGVNVLPATVFKLDAATGPLFPIVHLEKTNDDTAADVRVKRIACRTSD